MPYSVASQLRDLIGCNMSRTYLRGYSLLQGPGIYYCHSSSVALAPSPILQYKIILLDLKYLHHLAPPCLSNPLTPYQPAQSLRSTDAHLLTVPHSWLCSTGDRAFSGAGPKLWNTLPLACQCTTPLSLNMRTVCCQLYVPPLLRFLYNTMTNH